MLREFRDFIAKGNVLDLAVAVIIGAAFATITTSLTGDIIMPVVAAVTPDPKSWQTYTTQGPIPFKLGDLGEPAEEKARTEPGAEGDDDGTENLAPPVSEAPKPAAKAEANYSSALPLPSFMAQTVHLVRRR